MSGALLLDTFIRVCCYLAALFFLVAPGRQAQYSKLYRWLVFFFLGGLGLSILVGVPINSEDSVNMELLKSTLSVSGFGVCGFVATRRLGQTSLTGITVVASAVVLLRLIGMATGQAFLGGIMKSDSTAIGYTTAFMVPVGLWLLVRGRWPWAARLIAGCAWAASLASMAKWNLVIIVLTPVVWIAIEGRGKLRLLWKIASIMAVAVASISFSIYIEDISQQTTGMTLDQYIDHHFTKKDDLSSGRFDMWQEQLERLAQNPATGIGIGSWVPEYEVEDHNAYVFFLTRFGIFIGTGFLILAALCIRDVINASRNDQHCYWIALLTVANTAFVCAVGEAYSNPPAIAVMGIALGLCLRTELDLRAVRSRTILRTYRIQNAHSFHPARVIGGGLRN